MNDSLLTPNIEKRINTLIQVNDRKNLKGALKRKTITISREFGCEAYPLSRYLEKKLNLDVTSYKEKWNIYDKELLKLISKNEDLSENFLSHVMDDARLSDFMATFMHNQITNSETYEKIVEYIAKIAFSGNAIIVGRGASIIASKIPECYHFRLCASFESRVNSIARRLEVSHNEAKEIVVEKQQKRDEFLNRYFNTRIDDEHLYHAVFNQDKLSLDQISDQIIEIINKKGFK